MKWIQVSDAHGTPYELALSPDGVLRFADATGVRELCAPKDVNVQLSSNRKFVEMELPGVGWVRSDELLVLDAWFAHLDLSGNRRADAKRMSPGKLVAVIFGTLLLALGLLIWLGVPWLANSLARSVPSEWEASLAEGTLQSLEESGFSASKLSAERQAHYREQFARLTENLDYDVPLRLEFRSWEAPNAFAVPGGLVLITDQMLELMDNDEEFLAVMAHEVGHLEHRHSLRSVLQQGGLWLVISLIFGDTSGLASVAQAMPAFLIDSAYSRGFESEADQYAFQQLKAIGISPKHFGNVMRKLKEASGKELAGTKYFSSHPATDDRIEAAEDAAR